MVPKVEKRDCKLFVDRHLVLRSITYKDGIILNSCDKFVKRFGIDAQILSELFVVVLLIQDQNKM